GGLASCTSGCATGQVRCGSSCVDTTSDPTNCGTCGTACPAALNASRTCSASVCGQSCLAGYADCNGIASDGCETNTQSSAGNCGTCGTVCMGGAHTT